MSSTWPFAPVTSNRENKDHQKERNGMFQMQEESASLRNVKSKYSAANKYFEVHMKSGTKHLFMPSRKSYPYQVLLMMLQQCQLQQYTITLVNSLLESDLVPKVRAHFKRVWVGLTLNDIMRFIDLNLLTNRPVKALNLRSFNGKST